MGIDEGGQGVHQGAPFRWGERAPGRGLVGGAGSRDGGVDIGGRGSMDRDYGGFVAGGWEGRLARLRGEPEREIDEDCCR